MGDFISPQRATWKPTVVPKSQLLKENTQLSYSLNTPPFLFKNISKRALGKILLSTLDACRDLTHGRTRGQGWQAPASPRPSTLCPKCLISGICSDHLQKGAWAEQVLEA